MLRPILLLTCALLLASDPGWAHLSVIRQGPESADFPGANEAFGQALAVGDFNGDGWDDLATGAPLESNDPNPGPAHGIVVVNYGAAYGLTHLESHTVSAGAPADAIVRFGHALAAGDFNGDEYDDLAIGAPFTDFPGEVDAGLVWVSFGSASGLDPTPDPWDQSMAGGVVEAFDLFGFSLAAGDLDLDGIDDLAVGAVGEQNQSGVVSMFLGSAGGLTAPGYTFASISVGSSSSPGDQFGYSLAIDDFDHTSSGDLMIGAPFWDNALLSSSDAGRVFVVEMIATGPVVTTVEIITPDEIFGGDVQPNANFGFSLATGDVIGFDDEPELIVGEPGYPDGAFERSGRVAWFNDPSNPTGGFLTQGDAGEDPAANEEFGFSVATGEMRGSRASLVIGVPGEYVSLGTEGFQSQSGMAVIFFGGPPYWQNQDSELLRPDELNDFANMGARLGHAVAIGSFGSWDSGMVAVGAPNRDYQIWLGEDDSATFIESAGSVHTWGERTGVYNMGCRSAAAFNCFDELVFSVRPFDRTRPASTTKTMTMLLMAEAIDQGLDPEVEYAIPDYLAGDCYDGFKGGSQMEFLYDERVTVTNLLRMLASISANDAGYMLADIWSGCGGSYPNDGDCLRRAGIPDATVPFVQAMNDRADQLGMSSGTLFLTPVGRDQEYEWQGSDEKHRATAADWGKLGRAVVSHPYLRELTGTTDWEFDRRVVEQNSGFSWNETLSFKWLKTVKGFDDRIIGGKSGNTKWGGSCGIFFAEDDTGTQIAPVVAAIFGADVRGWSQDRGAELCQFAMEEAGCSFIIGGTVPGPPVVPLGRMESASTAQGERSELKLETDLAENLVLGAHGQLTVNADGSHAITNCLQHDAGVFLGPGESGAIAVTGFEAHDGLSVVNDGDVPFTAQVEVSVPAGSSWIVTLLPGDRFDVVAHAEPTASFELRVTSFESAASIAVGLHAQWRFDLQLGDRPFVDSWNYQISRDAPAYSEAVTACLEGQDAGVSGLVAFSISAEGTATAVDHGGHLPAGSSILGDARAYPNPLNARTVLRFELRESGAVSVAVFDLRGRKVRQLASGRVLDAGTHTLPWNGRDGAEAPVASGVYYWQIETRDGTRAVPMVLVE